MARPLRTDKARDVIRKLLVGDFSSLIYCLIVEEISVGFLRVSVLLQIGTRIKMCKLTTYSEKMDRLILF